MHDKQTLVIIAADMGLAVDTFRVDGESVFYEEQDGALRCACAVGSPYWQACSNKAA